MLFRLILVVLRTVTICLTGSDRFLPEHPLVLLRKSASIPLIIGFNAQESAFMVPIVMKSIKLGKTRFGDLFDVSAKNPNEVTFSECKNLHLFLTRSNLKCKK